jgi:hypothetical protein
MSDLGLAVGQTWNTREKGLVHIVAAYENGFVVQRANGFDTKARVRRDGSCMDYSTGKYDLTERAERVYIAGPMTGHADLNFPAFNAAAAEYRRRGCFVINPAEINGGENEVTECADMTPEQYQAHWQACMRHDIAALVTCGTIVMLDGWLKSRGATLEHHIARELGLTICYPIDTFKD